MPDRRDTRATDPRTSGAGRWAAIIIGIVILLALLGWMVGWFGGEEDVLVETEQPAALEGEEAIVAPEPGAEEVVGEEAPAGDGLAEEDAPAE